MPDDLEHLHYITRLLICYDFPSLFYHPPNSARTIIAQYTTVG